MELVSSRQMPQGKSDWPQVSIPDGISVARFSLDRSQFPTDPAQRLFELTLEFNYNGTWGADYIEPSQDPQKPAKLYSGRRTLGINGGALIDRRGQPITHTRGAFELPPLPNRKVRGSLVLLAPVKLDLQLDFG